jgi:hypothetical protein
MYKNTQQTKDRTTRTTQKKPGLNSGFCSVCGTCRVTLGTNPGNKSWMRKEPEHICGHLRHIFRNICWPLYYLSFDLRHLNILLASVDFLIYYQGLIVTKLKSSFRMFYGLLHNLVKRYGIYVSNDHIYVLVLSSFMTSIITFKRKISG